MGGLNVAFLSGVQVDSRGRINNSVIGNFQSPKVRLSGGAGSAVLLPNVKNAFIWRTKHDLRSLVKTVDFVTASGNVSYIFTPLCIFIVKNEKFQVEEILPGITVEEIRENTEFSVEIEPCWMPTPTEKEMFLLNKVDPESIRSSEFK